MSILFQLFQGFTLECFLMGGEWSCIYCQLVQACSSPPYRQTGQSTTDEIRSRDLRRDLEERERESRDKREREKRSFTGEGEAGM